MLNKSVFKKILLIGLKVFGVLFGLLLLNMLWLKFMPVMFTSTMLSRSLEAMAVGKPAEIYYEWASYDQIADYAKICAVASEDQRFPTHTGIDWDAVKSAVEENKHNKIKRGASTISQQVAKNVFLWQGGGYFRKALEVPITYMIEMLWGKKRILEMYLNIAEMGDRTFGIQAASKKYFKKKASALLPAECARVIAVLPNPHIYLIQNPSQIVVYKQNFILGQVNLLGGYGYLQNMR